MRTFIADIIPSIQRYSQRLDDLTRLTNQHWVSLGEINDAKKVYIFRTNGQLLISKDGLVDKGSWEYLGNQSLLLDTTEGSYLLKHGFFDENVIALKLDSSNAYAFFVNETKYGNELNNIGDVLKFLTDRYGHFSKSNAGINNDSKSSIDQDPYDFTILNEVNDFDLVWGSHTSVEVQYQNGMRGYVFKGHNSGKYFYSDIVQGIVYSNSKEEAIYQLYNYLMRNKAGFN